MGMSTDAILFYGTLMPEEWADGGGTDSKPEWMLTQKFPEWEKRYAELHGTQYVWDEEAGSSNYGDVLDVAKQSDCKLDYHCSSEYPMYYVAVKESTRTANRGFPRVVQSLVVDATWPDAVRKFCAEMELPCGELGWYLVSHWSH